MSAIVAEETTAKIQTLSQTALESHNQRRHFTIRNKYAVGILRDKKEIVIYDYDRSIRPLARIIVESSLITLRLGFNRKETEEILETLQRIMLHIDEVIEAQPKKKPRIMFKI